MSVPLVNVPGQIAGRQIIALWILICEGPAGAEKIGRLSIAVQTVLRVGTVMVYG